MLLKAREKPVGVDLFCGAGGMSLGFEQAGFDVVAAFDSEPIHVQTHSINFPECRTFCEDLSQLSGNELCAKADLEGKNIDVLFGGPPCQGFSTGGRRRLDDPRNMLLQQFARLVSELEPSYFVIENVNGLMMGDTKDLLDALLTRFASMGYSVVRPVKVFDAKDFGVPQTRRRVFIVGHKEHLLAPAYPLPSTRTIRSEGDSAQPTVWDAIGDLPNVDDYEELLESDVFYGELGTPSGYASVLRGDMYDDDHSHPTFREEGLTGLRRTAHTEKTRQRFAATMPGTREAISRYYRLTKEGVSTTLRAGTDNTGGSHTAPRPIHPVYPRCITVREAARLQSFPDWFQLHSTKWHGFRQVGNSVPPLLARAVAKSVISALELRDEKATELVIDG